MKRITVKGGRKGMLFSLGFSGRGLKTKRIAVKGRQKGILFSLDFSISFVLMLVMVLVFAATVFSFRLERDRELEEYRIAKNRVLFLDSLLKLPLDGNQPGLALFDAQKRRVLENRLAGIQLQAGEHFGLAEMRAECGNSSRLLYSGQAESRECEVMPRIAFFGGERCLLLAKFCEENTGG